MSDTTKATRVTERELTEDEWLDLASRHSNQDWDSERPDGYLDAVKRLCADFVVTVGYETLWAVNVHGPDDLYAMPSKTAALERANEMNVHFGAMDFDGNDPLLRAVAVPWPHSAESHRAALAKAIGQ